MGLEQQAYDAAVFIEGWSNLWKQVSIRASLFESLNMLCA